MAVAFVKIILVVLLSVPYLLWPPLYQTFTTTSIHSGNKIQSRIINFAPKSNPG
ncbi:hypothetical protein C1H46_026917 [Malus baccata]|uniref:Uncharacterized protein n=1 Tax=Malus baccata TaxID=106549 RepID=A0A540LLZ9_MALBA|nr:hypothetical protein C1H46_026917 [Malus baccata]